MTLVTVLVNPACPHCVRAIDHAADLAEACGAHVAAVDVTAHADVAHALHVRTSPVVLFEGRVAHPGIPDADTFAALARGTPFTVAHHTRQEETTT